MAQEAGFGTGGGGHCFGAGAVRGGSGIDLETVGVGGYGVEEVFSEFDGVDLAGGYVAAKVGCGHLGPGVGHVRLQFWGRLGEVGEKGKVESRSGLRQMWCIAAGLR